MGGDRAGATKWIDKTNSKKRRQEKESGGEIKKAKETKKDTSNT